MDTVSGWPINMSIKQFHVEKKIGSFFNNEDSSQTEIIGTSDALNSPHRSSISDGGQDPPGLILSIISMRPISITEIPSNNT